MPSIRHHLTLAEASLVTARAHLESAFEHTIHENYDSRWTQAIDVVITEAAATRDQVFNIKTVIEPPATSPNSKEQPGG